MSTDFEEPVSRSRHIHGWRVVGLATLVIAASLLSVALRHGWSDEGLQGAIRVTARSSFVLFLAAFSASSIDFFLPSKATRWLLRNRRFFGISFAFSHLVHGAMIVTLAIRTGGGSLTARVIGLGSAALLYGFIVAMLATSFDRTARWVGPKAWRRLHSTGSYLIFLTFLATYGRLARDSPGFLVLFGLLLIVWGLRIARRTVIRRRRPAG